MPGHADFPFRARVENARHRGQQNGRNPVDVARIRVRVARPPPHSYPRRGVPEGTHGFCRFHGKFHRKRVSLFPHIGRFVGEHV